MVKLRQKATLILLVFYWSALIVAAHIPIPMLVRKAGVSDKGLHFIAYLILTFLLWYAIRPNEKVKWHTFTAWLVLFIVTGYGAVDEVVQRFVGRTCDIMDIAANIAGILTALVIFSVFNFWPAALSAAVIVIFVLTNITKANPDQIMPHANIIFHLFAYAAFTLLWIQNIGLGSPDKKFDKKWLIEALSIPAGLLLLATLFSVFIGRYRSGADIVVSLGAIVAVAGLTYLKRHSKSLSGAFFKRPVQRVANQK
jgi:hypothetical protein